MEATKFVPLKPEITEKINKTKKEDCETSHWIGEAFKLQEKKTESGKSKRKTKYLMVTEACIYVIDKEFEKSPKVFSIFDVKSLINQTEYVTVEFSKKTYQFIVSDPAAFISSILSQAKRLSYQINSSYYDTLCPITKSPDYKAQVEVTKRPSYLLTTRYISLCALNNAEPHPSIISVFKNYDQELKTFIRLSNENNPFASSSSMILALTFENQIRNVILDNFGHDTLDQIINCVLTNECSFVSLDLWRYEQTPSLKALNGLRSPYNHLKTIRFHYCSSSFVDSFLSYIRTANFSIDTLVFDNIQFDPECSENFVQLLQSTTFLSSLTSLAFLSCSTTSSSDSSSTPSSLNVSSTKVPFLSFVQKCVHNCPELLNLTCDNCEVDVCSMLVEIMKNQVIEVEADDDTNDQKIQTTKLQRISLRNNSGQKVVSFDKTILADSFLIIDIGECEWTTEALISFISAICHSHRCSPLALIMDHITFTTPSNWSELFERLPTDHFVPNITELNISGNEFDTKAFDLFLKFLDTQSPFMSVCKTKLKHLNINNCIKENQAENLKKLIDFLGKRELWGLEICGCPPTSALLDITNLYALNIGDNEFDKNSMKTVMKIINNSPNLTEIGLNNVKFPDVKTMMQFFTNVLAVSKLLAYDPLTTFYNEYSTYPETAHIKHFLTKKREFSKTEQRIGLFLTMAGDFETHVASPLIVADTEEAVKDKSKKSLFKSIKLPGSPPSLLAMAFHTSHHSAFDPLALMVADYVETNAKFGVLPPTAPPSEPSTTEFMMPSIFATMSTKNEVDGDDNITDFDPLSEDNQKLSEKLAIALRANSKRIVGNREFWKDPKSQSVFKLIDPQSK